MPIAILEKQQRLRSLGEIRIGHTVAMKGVDKNGRPKRRPEKLSKFRFTSPSKTLLEKVAALYGGEVKPWTPQNGGPAEWELYSTANEVPVLIPPNSVSQWFELYEGPRCVRRCDGERETRADRPCVCDPKGVLAWSDERPCAVTTKLNVMLRDLPAIGLWLLTSHGKNSAVEIPPLATIVAAAEGYVTARLGMEARTTYPLEGAPFHYMVPVLEVDQVPTALMPGAAGAPSIEDGAKKALQAAPKAIEAKSAPAAQDDPGPEYFKAQADSAETIESLTKALLAAQAVGRAQEGDPLFKHFVARRAEIEESEVAVAEIVEDEPGGPISVSDRLLFQIAENAGDWNTERLNNEFAKRNGGVLPASASEQQLGAFLQWLQNGGAR